MSFIVNAVNFRLGYTKYWNNIWSLSSNINYSFLANMDNNIINYIYTILDLYWLKTMAFMISNVKIFRVNIKIYILIYIRFQLIEVSELFLNPFVKMQRYFVSDGLKLSKVNLSSFFLKCYFRKFWALLIILRDYSIFKDEGYRYQTLRKVYFKILKVLIIYVFYQTEFNFVDDSWGGCHLVTWKSTLVFYLIYMYIYKWYIQWINLILISKMRRFFKQDQIFQIYTVFMPLEEITAFFLVRYIQLKLIQRHPIKKIIGQLFKNFSKNKFNNFFKGVKICVSGRFTRHDRKLFFWKSLNKIGYSCIDEKLDYFADTIILSNSICGVKVWVNQRTKVQKYFVY